MKRKTRFQQTLLSNSTYLRRYIALAKKQGESGLYISSLRSADNGGVHQLTTLSMFHVTNPTPGSDTGEWRQPS
jgi:hypothetical protein